MTPNTRYKQAVDAVDKFIESNGRPPKHRELAGLIGVHKSTAGKYLWMIERRTGRNLRVVTPSSKTKYRMG